MDLTKWPSAFQLLCGTQGPTENVCHLLQGHTVVLWYWTC